MGKSPGKWIKTTLFGKKNSKINLSKNASPDKMLAAKAPVEDVSRTPPAIPDSHQLTETNVENFEIEKVTSASPCDSIAVSHVNQIVHPQSNGASVPLIDGDAARREQAATKTQAAVRGYLARRAFLSLKGIVRVQAFIRGHLVRRQAVSTLRCMQAIIRFQALARGRKVDGSNSIFRSVKLTRNIFVHKLLIILPTAMPLRLQYDAAEPNSARNWLDRWSVSRFWDPVKTMQAKPEKKKSKSQVHEPDYAKSKRTGHKPPSTMSNVETSFEIDKSKRPQWNTTSSQTMLAQEQPQTELERIKSNLRKVPASATAAPAPAPVQNAEIATNAAPLDTSKQEVTISKDDQVDSGVVINAGDLFEARSTKPPDRPPVIENTRSTDDVLSSKDEKNGKDKKFRKMRSLSVKHEGVENIAQNSQCIPSYMAATASAKAKLRMQGSPRFGEDGGDSRRHSLPALVNGKSNSMSPRIHKHVQANGKGGGKMNRSLTSSRDGLLHDKAMQPVWKR